MVAEKDATEVRKHIQSAIKYAATCHCEVEELFDMEEITEEMTSRPKWRFDQAETAGLKHRMVEAAVGKKLYQCLRCCERSISGKVPGI